MADLHCGFPEHTLIWDSYKLRCRFEYGRCSLWKTRRGIAKNSLGLEASGPATILLQQQGLRRAPTP